MVWLTDEKIKKLGRLAGRYREDPEESHLCGGFRRVPPEIVARMRASRSADALLDSDTSTVGVAQLVELLVVVQAVGGSSPLAHPS